MQSLVSEYRDCGVYSMNKTGSRQKLSVTWIKYRKLNLQLLNAHLLSTYLSPYLSVKISLSPANSALRSWDPPPYPPPPKHQRLISQFSLYCISGFPLVYVSMEGGRGITVHPPPPHTHFLFPGHECQVREFRWLSPRLLEFLFGPPVYCTCALADFSPPPSHPYLPIFH
jgi:hypothetical protein